MLQLVSVALFVTVSWFFRNQSPELRSKGDGRGGGDAEEQDRDRDRDNGDDDSKLQLSGKCVKRTRRRWWWSRHHAQSREPELIVNPVVALALQETTRVVNNRSRGSRGGGGGLGVIVVALDDGASPLRSNHGNDAATIGRKPETLRINRLLAKRFIVPSLGLWERGVFVHPTALVESLRDLGDGATVWHFCHIIRGARVGSNVSLGKGCFVADGAVVGHNCRLQNGVSVFKGVILDDDVFVGPNVTFTNVKRPRATISQHGQYLNTRVMRGATLGAACTLLPGLTIGRYCIVGAGAVVTADVPEFAVVVGNPARQIGWADAQGNKAVRDLEFGKSGRGSGILGVPDLFGSMSDMSSDDAGVSGKDESDYDFD